MRTSSRQRFINGAIGVQHTYHNAIATGFDTVADIGLHILRTPGRSTGNRHCAGVSVQKV
jgi:hypothetical protein